MSQRLRKYANKRDSNEPEIIDTLKAQGFSVKTLDGPSDLCVGLPWLTALVEVKNGKKGKLTKAQKDFIASHKGPYYVVYTTEDAEKLVVFLKRKSQFLTKHLGNIEMYQPIDKFCNMPGDNPPPVDPPPKKDPEKDDDGDA